MVLRWRSTSHVAGRPSSTSTQMDHVRDEATVQDCPRAYKKYSFLVSLPARGVVYGQLSRVFMVAANCLYGSYWRNIPTVWCVNVRIDLP